MEGRRQESGSGAVGTMRVSNGIRNKYKARESGRMRGDEKKLV